MSKLLCFLVVFCLTTTLSGQTLPESHSKKNKEIGFYGKRFSLQLGAGTHHNTLLKLAGKPERSIRERSYYDKYRSQTTNDLFNYSVYANIGATLRERIALSLDFHYYFGDIFFRNLGTLMHYNQPPYTGYYFTSKYDCRVKYNTMRFMPRVELFTKHSNAPSGLAHILGFGIELSQLKSGNYRAITAYSIGHSMDPDSIRISKDQITLSSKIMFNVSVLYGLEYRLPISKSLAWNFGAYAHINFPVIGITFIDQSQYHTEAIEQERQLARYRFQNLFSVRTGLVVML